MAEKSQTRQYWATRLGVIMAVTGSAVGLGNFLRFPGKAAQYEGGAFMIPYFVALLLLGLPMAWAEWAMGRYGGRLGYNSSPGIYRAICRSDAAAYIGVLGLLIPVGIYMYYILIESWCLGYAWNIAVGNLSLGSTDPALYQNFLANFTGLKEHGGLFSQEGIPTLIFLAICIFLNFFFIYRGLQKGIERFCLWAMPALVLCALIVVIRVLTLGTPNPDKPELNVLNGLGFMWNPRTQTKGFLESLANGQMWLEAAGQIFFSLSVGLGVIVNYASYVREDDDIALSALTSCAGNEFCEVALGGLMTVPAAFVFFGAAAVTGSAFSLGFLTLPMVFASMPLGRLVGTLFFSLLFLAALTSSLSMLQPAIALLEEGLGLGRRAAVSLLGFITLVGTGFVMYFSKNLLALDTFDFWVGTLAIYLLATFQIILFGWVLGLDRGMAEINRGAEIRIPYWIGWIIKYISPVYLILIFLFFLYQNAAVKIQQLFSDHIAMLSVGFIILVAALFGFFIAASIRRWRAQETQRAEIPV